MKRRDYLKNISLTSLGLAAMNPEMHAAELLDKPKVPAPKAWNYGRTDPEKKRDAKLFAETYLNAHEIATITILSDIIIPADERGPSASQTGVPEFIGFMVKDKPELQVPIRGGLRWLDSESIKRFEKKFIQLSQAQKIAIVDDIAYPKKVKPGYSQGTNFFSLMRNLTATGYWSSKEGIKDIGYKGNVPNNWDGVPSEILKEFGVNYDS
jgi:gluconate 2-dehydrogenase gamma chain